MYTLEKNVADGALDGIEDGEEAQVEDQEEVQAGVEGDSTVGPDHEGVSEGRARN